MYTFYKEQYHGSVLEAEEFPEVLARAEDYLGGLSRRYRVEGSKTDRSMALCAMAEAMAYFDGARNGQGGLRYASVGTVSMSGKGVYSAVDISPAAQERELIRAAERYLTIYRGASCLC